MKKEIESYANLLVKQWLGLPYSDIHDYEGIIAVHSLAFKNTYYYKEFLNLAKILARKSAEQDASGMDRTQSLSKFEFAIDKALNGID